MIEGTAIDNNTTLYFGDCLEVMPQLALQGFKADLVLADIPFGTTNCKWDSVIDTTQMWSCLDEITEANTAVLLFAQQPFTSTLGCSNLKNLRYNWVWEKTQGTGFLNAKRMPLKCHEDILVFYKKLPAYYPIKTYGHKRKVVAAEHQLKCNAGDIYRKHDNYGNYDSTERYPRSVLKFKTDKQTSALHPTQKPVALLEYLIRTYTKEGDTVIDFASGSMTTAVAAMNTNRKCVCIEKDCRYFDTGKERLINHLNTK